VWCGAILLLLPDPSACMSLFPPWSNVQARPDRQGKGAILDLAAMLEDWPNRKAFKAFWVTLAPARRERRRLPSTVPSETKAGDRIASTCAGKSSLPMQSSGVNSKRNSKSGGGFAFTFRQGRWNACTRMTQKRALRCNQASGTVEDF
jgi:hypothetical protein